MVKGIDWYTERILGEISLGGLFILVVIRTIQHNMLKMRVRYYRILLLFLTETFMFVFECVHKKLIILSVID
jgi:hypothetical protein